MSTMPNPSPESPSMLRPTNDDRCTSEQILTSASTHAHAAVRVHLHSAGEPVIA